MGTIFAIIAFLNNLYDVWKNFMNARDVQGRADDEKKRQEREKAVDGAASGETDDDIFKSETGVVDNLP